MGGQGKEIVFALGLCPGEDVPWVLLLLFFLIVLCVVAVAVVCLRPGTIGLGGVLKHRRIHTGGQIYGYTGLIPGFNWLGRRTTWGMSFIHCCAANIRRLRPNIGQKRSTETLAIFTVEYSFVGLNFSIRVHPSTETVIAGGGVAPGVGRRGPRRPVASRGGTPGPPRNPPRTRNRHPGGDDAQQTSHQRSGNRLLIVVFVHQPPSAKLAQQHTRGPMRDGERDWRAEGTLKDRGCSWLWDALPLRQHPSPTETARGTGKHL